MTQEDTFKFNLFYSLEKNTSVEPSKMISQDSFKPPLEQRSTSSVEMKKEEYLISFDHLKTTQASSINTKLFSLTLDKDKEDYTHLQELIQSKDN